MAQTKRKRRTKHRGNAMGVVEARGRTGRKLTDQERKAASGKGAGKRSPREDRFNKPPTWRGAINRSLIAVVFFVALLVLIFKQPAAQVLSLAAVLLVLYVPLSYYTDLWLYRRRLAKAEKARAKAGKEA
ncbi:MAG TPA: hypothetical protein VMT10_12800 [Solirubrobacteraceae bacterium]|nr:hypothetical protein [Solirubrobacteraceae bacterium]